MKKTDGFSLLEMMIVLLIISIVAAAIAPMVGKKAVKGTDSPWAWTNNNSITYNPKSEDIKTVSIGIDNIPALAGNARLYVDSNLTGVPQLALGYEGSNTVRAYIGNEGIIFNSRTAVNPDARAGSTVWGHNAKAAKQGTTLFGGFTEGKSSTSVGTHAISATGGSTVGFYSEGGSNTIAVGRDIRATGKYGVGIGRLAVANSGNHVAIGTGATVKGDLSVALGHSTTSKSKVLVAGEGASADGESATVLGTDSKADAYGVALGYWTESKNKGISIGSKISSNKNGIGIGADADKDEVYLGKKTHSVSIPGRRLEVSQDALFNNNVNISGNLTVGGMDVQSALDDLENRYNILNDKVRGL